MRSGNHSHDAMLRDLNDLFARRGAQTSAVTIAIIVIGVIGNTFVLLAYWKLYKRKSKQLKGRYFMPHLALADLIACVVGCFVFLYFDFHRVTFTSDIGCRLSTFSAWSTNAVSVLMLLVISVNRYLKICRPIHQQMTLFWKRASLVIITVVSVISCLPFLHFSGVRTGKVDTTEFADVLDLPTHLVNKTLTYHQCATAKYNNLLWKLFYNFLFLVQFGNMVAMIFLYVPMGRLIYEKYREHKESRSKAYPVGVSTDKGTATNTVTTATTDTASNDESGVQSTDILGPNDQLKVRKPRGRNHKAWNNAKNRFTIMFLVVVIVYAITNLPTFIFLYAYMESTRFRRHFISDSDFESYNLILSLPRIHLINNIVNPFLYGYFDLTFRREVKAICTSIFMKPKQLCCSRD